VRSVVALAAVATLLLGQGAATALADAPGTPIPTSAQPLSFHSMRVTWRNTASPLDEFHGEGTTLFNLRYRVQGAPDDFPSYTYFGGGGPPDDRGVWANNPLPASVNRGDILTYDVDGLSPLTTYCISVRAYALEIGVFSSYTALSPWSGEVCAQTPMKEIQIKPGGPRFLPPNLPPHDQSSGAVPGLGDEIQDPDLVAVKIDGPRTVKDGVAQTYQAVVRNDGGATTGLEAQINFSGAVEAWSLPQPGTAAGMTCTEIATPSGTAFSCKGGTIAAGQTLNVQFQAHAAKTGGGDISIVLNPSRTLKEKDYNNDVAAIHVTVN
jgi:hypothetical protein